MAKTGPVALPADVTASDANFRAWVQGIHDALIAIGLVQTSDTGQINKATVTKPAGTSTAAGYEIFRFNDDLQSTLPIFIKVEFGTGTSSANATGMWITVGSSTDGAGNVTGQKTGRLTTSSGHSPTGGAIWSTYACGDVGTGGKGYMWLATNIQAAATAGAEMFAVERSRGADGVATGDGFAVWNAYSSTPVWQAIPSTGAIPSSGTYRPTVNPASWGLSSRGLDVALATEVWFLGKPFYILSELIASGSDISGLSTFSVTHLGASHTFLSFTGSIGAVGVSGGGVPMLIWE